MRQPSNTVVMFKGCAGVLATLALILALVLPLRSATAWPEFADYQIDWGLGADQVNTADLPTDTTNFDGQLSSADTTVQAALETLDDAGSPLTTKGDLYTYDTADQRLGVGTNNQVLHADSTAATGLAWKAMQALIVGLSDAGGYFASTNVEGALQEVGEDIAAWSPPPLCWQLTAEQDISSSVSTNIEVSVVSEAHATYGGYDVCGIQHIGVYDFTNHETTDDYTELTPGVKVIVDEETLWQSSTQTVFFTGFRKPANTVTVTARIRRSGSTGADAYTRVRLVLSDETGAHSTNTSKLISAVGTSWEDLTLASVDVSSYDSELEWALEIMTDSVPATTTDATSTLQVHNITVAFN